MIIIGIDPGIAVLGIAAIQSLDHSSPHGTRRDRVIAARTIRTRASDPLPMRIQMLRLGITEFVADLKPDLLAIEDQAPGQRGAQRIGRRSAAAENVRRVVGLCEGLFDCPVVEPAPAQINGLIGLGRASKGLSMDQARKRRKAAVRAWVERVLGYEAASKDANDAIAIAVMGARIWRAAATSTRCARGGAGATERVNGVVR